MMSIVSSGVQVCRRWEAKPFIEGDEVIRIYFSSDKIVFSASTLQPGQSSTHDPGHEGAHEVVFCISGEIFVELGEDGGEFVALAAGDAALIEEGVPHRVINAGDETAFMAWATAPSLGRPLIYEDA